MKYFYKNSKLSAVLLPGIFFGILLGLIFSAGIQILESALVGVPRAHIYLVMLLIAPPIILMATGIASEKILRRNPFVTFEPLVHYCSGFLAAFIACNLIMAESYMSQYVPYLESGFFPRIAFVIGILIFISPVLIIVSGLFAVFSLAGAWLTHRMEKLSERQD